MSPDPEAVGGGKLDRRLAQDGFEKVYGELQQVVAELEDGGLDLARALLLFERGSQLAQVCEQIVDAAELRVTQLAAESSSVLPDEPVEP